MVYVACARMHAARADATSAKRACDFRPSACVERARARGVQIKYTLKKLEQLKYELTLVTSMGFTPSSGAGAEEQPTATATATAAGGMDDGGDAGAGGDDEDAAAAAVDAIAAEGGGAAGAGGAGSKRRRARGPQ